MFSEVDKSYLSCFCFCFLRLIVNRIAMPTKQIMIMNKTTASREHNNSAFSTVSDVNGLTKVGPGT